MWDRETGSTTAGRILRDPVGDPSGRSSLHDEQRPRERGEDRSSALRTQACAGVSVVGTQSVTKGEVGEHREEYDRGEDEKAKQRSRARDDAERDDAETENEEGQRREGGPATIRRVVRVGRDASPLGWAIPGVCLRSIRGHG